MIPAGRHLASRAAVGVMLSSAVLVGGGALSGCDGEARPKPSATVLPQGISATLLPSETADQAVLRIDNEVAEALRIRAMRIEDPRFAWAGWPVAVRDRIVPGMSVSLIPVALPDARCSAAEGDGTRVTVSYSLGASSAVASAGIADPAGVVASLTTTACDD